MNSEPSDLEGSTKEGAHEIQKAETASMLQSIVEKVLDKRIVEFRHQPFGHCSLTFDVALEDGRNVIVRTNEDTKVYSFTSSNMKILSALSLPLPTILKSGVVELPLSHKKIAYMVLNKIPGQDLRFELSSMNTDQINDVAEQVVRYQRIVNKNIRGNKHGYASIGQESASSSWMEFLQGQINACSSSTPLKAYIESSLSKLKHLLDQILPLCFLDDITGKNVIVDQGTLKGLIDFDCVCYGDPMWWLSLTWVGLVNDIEINGRVMEYITALKHFWDLSSIEKELLPFYCLIHALSFLTRSDGAESERLLNEIDAWKEDLNILDMALHR